VRRDRDLDPHAGRPSLKPALAFLLFLAVACSVDDSGTDPAPGTVLVDIRDTEFNPDTVHVLVGRHVRWTNRGAQIHAISSTVFTSQNLFPTWWVEARFDAAGAYDYYCTLHEAKEGTIIVE
jgi:plastocyanin